MSDQRPGVRFSGTYAAVLSSLLLSIFIAVPLALLGLFAPQPSGYVWAALVFSATTLAIVLRSRRISLVVGPDGVEVHNFWRSYTLPWETIESVGQTSRSMLDEGGTGETIEFRLRGGRSAHSQATLGPQFWHAPMLEEIERYADDRSIEVS